MLASLLRQLPAYRRPLSLVFVLLVLEALLNTFSITMLVPIGEAVLKEDEPVGIAGISLDFLPESLVRGPNRVTWLLLVLGVLLVLKVLAGVTKELIAARVSRNLWARWVTLVTQGHLARPYSVQVQTESGHIINLASREANRASNLIVVYIGWLSSVITLSTLVVAMIVVDWRIVLATALIAVAAYGGILRPMISASRTLGQRSVAANHRLTSLVSQTVRGSKDILLLNMQRVRARIVTEVADEAADLDYRFSVLQAVPPYGLELVFAIGILGLSGLLMSAGANDREEWLPLALFFTAAIFRLSTHGATVASSRIKINNRYPSFQELVRLASDLPTFEATTEGDALEVIQEPIRVRGLVFSHDADSALLRGVDVDLPTDRLTFLVGPSGSGKSSFVDVLARLYLPQGGTVEVNGTDYLRYRLSDWRRCLGYVPQQPVLFSGSVRENVAAGDPTIDDAAVRRALELAGAGPFVSQLPDGIDSQLGEGGAGVSGGQLCRLAVARALARGPSMLVLDESTSGIEPQLERTILSDLKGIPDLGVLVVSHRSDNIDLADVVLEVAGGSIRQRADAQDQGPQGG